MLRYDFKKEIWIHQECEHEFEHVFRGWVYCPACGKPLGGFRIEDSMRRLAYCWKAQELRYPDTVKAHDSYVAGFCEALNRCASDVLEKLQGGDWE